MKLKTYLDYGTFQPIQIAATVTMNEAADYPQEVCSIYESRRDALCDGLARIGWDIPKPERHDVRVGADPRALPRARLGRVLVDAGAGVRRGHVARRGFGPGGEGFVRFALIENEQRIAQGIRSLRKGLTKL